MTNDSRGLDTGGPRRPEPRIPGDSVWASLPDALTWLRLLAVPPLWVVAFLGETTWLALGLAAAALTDALDGAIARRTHHATARGSRLDSLADHVLTGSTLAWLVWLRPEFAREQLVLLGSWGAVGVAALLVGWVRFRKFGDLHLYSAKVANLLGYLFSIWLLLFGTYVEAIFHLVIGVCILASTESLVVVATRDAADPPVGSILLRRRTSPKR